MMINGGTSTGEQINTSMFSTGIYANASTKMITANGFIKAGSSNSYVLLGDGSHKLESNLSVSSASTATKASYLPTKYDGGDKPNPQYYFNQDIGVRVAMTRHANIGGTTAWFDTLWINGYAGNDVPNMVALTTIRNGSPRAFLSTQSNRSTTYGTYYEIISSYNIGSQSVKYAASAGNADTIDNYHANGLLTVLSNSNNGISITVGGTTKSISNISVNYAASAGSASSATQATNLTPENTPHYFRDPSNSTWRGGMYWGSAGSESMSFVAVNSGTRFQFVGGSDIANWTSSTWQSVTPYLTIYSSGIITPGSVTATNGFIKSGSSNSYILLGAGGHKAISDFATSGHNHDGRYLRWNGSTADISAMDWGTLTTANGYTILSHAASSDGGDVGFTSKGGQIFM